jgi:hypothetical protein
MTQLLVWISLFAALSHAVEVCPPSLRQLSYEMLGGGRGYGRSIIDAHYEQAQNILLLGDSAVENFSMGERLATQFPNKLVVSTDYLFQGGRRVGNFIQMHLDNLREFPFPNNSFDVVVARRGLCICRGCTACAGFNSMNHEAYGFFDRVIRTLNKRNPNAIAILHGEYGTTPHVQRVWLDFLAELEEEYRVQAYFLYPSNSQEILNSIVIRPRAMGSGNPR